ncbi:outer membrane protein assembly factor BamD [Colwellia sp. MEBiC06753]
MEKLTFRALILASIVALSGCSSSDADIDKVPDSSAQVLFVDAREALDNGLYQKAIQILSAIDSRFPFGPISHQVQLDLIYAYYKTGNADQGVALADRFLRLNPTHPNVDYVYYMRALIKVGTEENLFQSLAGIDRSDRDPTASREAFNDLRKIVDDYPQSKYAADAKKRMIGIKSRLAQYELAVAEFYFKREAYVSAANRAKYIVEFYAPTKEVEKALEVMVECYQALGLTELMNNAKQVLAINYPQNPIVN